MTALSVRSLSKAYGGVQAVRDVSFDLEPGELLALIGPNGAGKTTCFNMLNGQIPPMPAALLFRARRSSARRRRRSGASVSAEPSRSPRPFRR